MIDKKVRTELYKAMIETVFTPSKGKRAAQARGKRQPNEPSGEMDRRFFAVMFVTVSNARKSNTFDEIIEDIIITREILNRI